MNTYKVLDLTLSAAKKWLHGMNERSVAATRTRESLHKALAINLEKKGKEPEEVIEHFLKATEGGYHGSGVAYFSPTTWKNKNAMRVSVINWQTSAEDIKRTVKELNNHRLKTVG